MCQISTWTMRPQEKWCKYLPEPIPFFAAVATFLFVLFLDAWTIEQRCQQIPDYLNSVLVPFIKKIFPSDANIFISLALNPNGPIGGNFFGDELYFQGFAGTQDVLASQVFPDLPHQNLSNELFEGINITTEMAHFSKTKYICIHTRNRSLNPPDKQFLHSLLFGVIGSSNYKVCLVGERTDMCNFSSIYGICRSLIPAESLVDFTSAGFTLNNLAIDSFLSSRSSLCIAFGIGGNVVMNSYAKTTTHTFVDLGSDHPFFNAKNPTLIYDNKSSFLLKPISTIGSIALNYVIFLTLTLLNAFEKY
mgnify:CR=1 FL=1